MPHALVNNRVHVIFSTRDGRNSSRKMLSPAYGVHGRRFAWQEGYAALSVSASHNDAVVRYICNQKEHRAQRTFEEELLQLLKKSGVDLDPGDVFG